LGKYKVCIICYNDSKFYSNINYVVREWLYESNRFISG
jgi:hypothetical protein